MRSTDLMLMAILTWSLNESSPKCESDMKPDGYVGQNTCKLQKENMTFTCTVYFNGTTPQMIWTTLNGSQSFNESAHKIENDQLISSLTIRADSKYDGTVFSCQSTESDAKCSTEIIKIQYFESPKTVVEQSVGDKVNYFESDYLPVLVKKNVSDRVNCSVTSNQDLKFKWTILQGAQYVPVVENQELIIPNPGFYRCAVKYSIRDVECSWSAYEVNVADDCTTVSVRTTPTTAAPTTAAPTIVLSVIVGFFVFVLL